MSGREEADMAVRRQAIPGVSYGSQSKRFVVE